MYCALCRKHGSKNLFNKSKTYSADPAVRFKKAALSDHSTSTQHKTAVTAEITQRTSSFHKDFVQSKSVRRQVYFNAFKSVYWLAKRGIPISNALPLIQLIEQMGNTDMKFFSHRSPGSVREIILTLGEVILNKILQKVNQSGKFGLLVDEVTDISTTEQMVAFIQYVTDTGLTETPFLYIADCLADSGSANSETLLKVITDNLTRLDLSTDNISGFVSDGASVMVGVKEGVATKLKRINPKIISVHCIAHRLALACTDTNADISYIKQVEEILRQLWQFMENSPKRTAAFVKVQQELLQQVQHVTVKGRRKVAHKLKKACNTRWLSFDASVQSFYHSIEAVVQTLNVLDQDAVATGLMTKIRQLRFLAAVYILKDTLPIIAQLSKAFQLGSVNFSHIAPLIQSTKDKLTQLSQTKTPVTKLREDLHEDGRLSGLRQDVTGMDSMEFHLTRMNQLLQKYITALKTNIDNRFSKSLPILTAFGMFNPEAVPLPTSTNFINYGEIHLDVLVNHFFPDDTESKQKVGVEWQNFKYQIVSWRDEMRATLQNTRHMKGCLTPTQWLLQKLMSQQLTYRPIYPCLLILAEVILSIPVSNAWPERGASKVKWLKSRLRSHTKNDLLQALLQITLNGPTTDATECEQVIRDATDHWLKKKTRRKLSQLPPLRAESTEQPMARLQDTTLAGVEAPAEDSVAVANLLNVMLLPDEQVGVDSDSETESDESETD